MKCTGVLGCENRRAGGLSLSDGSNCQARENVFMKLIRVIKLDMNAFGVCEGKERNLKGSWCDLCLNGGTISAAEFTCLNVKCFHHGQVGQFHLCDICEIQGKVKCPFSVSDFDKTLHEYFGSHRDHKFVRVPKEQRNNHMINSGTDGYDRLHARINQSMKD